MAGNDDLHPLLRSIGDTLGRLREDIKELTGEVKKVRTAIESGFETLQEAIHENTQAQAELKLIEHVAEVESIKPKITAKQDGIEDEREELNQKLSKVEERFEKRHEELNEKAEDRIRDVGEHIFEIDEGEFEDGIEGPFLEGITPTWFELAQKNRAVGEKRRERVERTVSETSEEIQSFIDHQEQLLDRIQRSRFDFPVRRPKTIQFPYYVVTVERDGVSESTVYIPSSVATEHGGGSLPDVDIREFSGLRPLVQPRIGKTSRRRRQPDRVRQAIETELPDGEVLTDASQSFEQALGDSLTVAVEEGE